MSNAKGKPVAYASRAVTSAEQNYKQIEKEMLAICFATSTFREYVYGKLKVSVQTDHKPLKRIMKKPLCKAPPILQRLMLLLQLRRRCTLRARKVHESC